jgi:hypothetical protein
MKFLHRTALAPAALCLAAATSVHAQQQRMEATFPATEETLVEVRNQVGPVKVQSWNQPQVRVVAMRRTPAVESHFEKSANRVHIHTHVLQPAAPASDRMVDYEIWAPADVRLSFYLESGTLQVENFSEDVTIETNAANVRLRNLSGNISVKTLSGSVEVEGGTGRLEVSSIGGTLRFRDVGARYLVANSTSGDIFYEGDFAPGGAYDFRNNEGLIELAAPVTASFELIAESVRGRVLNDFPLTPRSHGRAEARTSGLRSALLGTVHAGAALVRVTSFSGTIRVRKR